ncbi:hypothetical protein [Crossiella sp. NPDC003009]
MAPGLAAVAASREWTGEDGVRLPAGDVHAWWPRTNQTVCGLALRRSQLAPFPHVVWPDAVWLTQSAEARDQLLRLCHRCTAAMAPRPRRRERARR